MRETRQAPVGSCADVYVGVTVLPLCSWAGYQLRRDSFSVLLSLAEGCRYLRAASRRVALQHSISSVLLATQAAVICCPQDTEALQPAAAELG